ncbi:protein of unknown function [Methanoculleus bourgensis]|uniref:4Fe-4S ferredoxin-type domain-containing protein n=1 Tax=Methanoculleus bourgensis TaxID=83986 RepID=A0A0X3BMN2_9EURY|nr:protein of unknown function [Methanoculleus bourgensis]
MAFALHINMERCTGCNNCVVACPVDALELHTEDPVTKEKIYKVKDGKALSSTLTPSSAPVAAYASRHAPMKSSSL